MFVMTAKLSKPRLIAAGVLILAVVILVVALVSGGGDGSADAPDGATNDARLAYLAGFGWQIAPEPVETLHLQLPEDLSAEWRDYLKLQQSQGLPFGDYAGCEAERYTYNILNYPGVERGVQANIFVADGIVIAGDVVSTGEQSFQQGLAFPESGG